MTIKPETVEIDSRELAEYIIFQAKEFGEWEKMIPENIANEDEPWDAVRIGNVDTVDYAGDGIVEIGGSFTTNVVVERIPRTFHHPSEARTTNSDGWFHIRYSLEDEGRADGGIEVA